MSNGTNGPVTAIIGDADRVCIADQCGIWEKYLINEILEGSFQLLEVLTHLIWRFGILRTKALALIVCFLPVNTLLTLFSGAANTRNYIRYGIFRGRQYLVCWWRVFRWWSEQESDYTKFPSIFLFKAYANIVDVKQAISLLNWEVLNFEGSNGTVRSLYMQPGLGLLIGGNFGYPPLFFFFLTRVNFFFLKLLSSLISSRKIEY